MSGSSKFSRRGLLTGASLIAGATLVKGAEDAPKPGAGRAEKLGPGRHPLTLTVNGEKRTVQVEPRDTLAHVLRDELQLTGTKIGCDRGACGACTVHLDGTPVVSCLTFALDARGRAVTTIEGLARGEALSQIQQAFVNADALQCGFCTPGMVMSCAAALSAGKDLDEPAIRQAVSGNLCRCGTYPKVFEAALAAARGNVGLPESPKGDLVDDSKIDSTLIVGVEGTTLTKASRTVPEGEPNPWDGDAKLKVVGARLPRLDGPQKVTGKATYTFDVKLPGMLYAALVSSPHPHANIESIDLSAARNASGVKAAMAVERVLGPAKLKVQPKNKSKYPKVLYEGQAVAAVAARTQAQADDAARLVKVKYEPLPHVSDIDRAREPGAPLVFEGPVEQAGSAGGGGAAQNIPQKGNVRGPVVNERNEGTDMEKALASSANRIEATYRTQVQTHSAIETHGVVAKYDADGIEVWSSTQGLYTVRDELATLFDVPKSKVRVHCEFAGGGFGAKFGAGNYGAVATELSRLAKAPVRLFVDRRGEHLAVGNRPSTIQALRIGCDGGGKLSAIELKSYGSAGCAAGAGCSGPVRNMYDCPAVRTEENDVFLHSGPAAAFRAPGHPQGAFALEQALDELAEKIGVDPLDLRDKNDPHPARREERRKGRELIGWDEKRKVKPGASRGPLKRGVGFAQGNWYNFGGNSAAEVLIHNDGTVECRSGVQDIGGGIRTNMAQVVAEELGIEPRQVHVVIGDTNFPEGPASGGSKTTQLLLPAVRKAAFEARRQLFAKVPGATNVLAAARKLDVDHVRGLGERAKDYDGWTSDPRKDLAGRIGGAQFAEVEVDTETGVIRVVDVVAVHDCGRAVNRLTTESQINGGIIQGISFALFEDRILDRVTGRMVNANLEQYKIAGSKDVPRIRAVIVDHYRGRTNVDASGIGEPATVPTAAAIANAAYHATGVRIREAPMTPARVLAALHRGTLAGGAP